MSITVAEHGLGPRQWKGWSEGVRVLGIGYKPLAFSY